MRETESGNSMNQSEIILYKTEDGAVKAMDDERLKQSERWDYFDEWLERIRDIRASEKRFYQKIRDIYAAAIDYDKTSEAALLFFKKVQNKMLWAITGKTAAELIESRSNPDKPNKELTAFAR